MEQHGEEDKEGGRRRKERRAGGRGAVVMGPNGSLRKSAKPGRRVAICEAGERAMGRASGGVSRARS